MTNLMVDKFDIEKTSAPMILILGQTGAGKSHFCNKVLGEDVEEVEESARLASCTSKPQLVPAKVDGKEYLLIDTPGFNDTWKAFKRSDATILGEVAQILTLQTQLGVKLRGILYLYDITANRMTGESLRQFSLLQRIVGAANYANVLLVTTHWPQSVSEQPKCAVREGDLRRDFWRDMVASGSTMCRFDDRHATAKAIVRRLASKPDVTLTLQEELGRGWGLKRTEAFRFIVQTRAREEESVGRDGDGNGEVDAEGLKIRKEAEGRLNDDIVAKVQDAIVEEESKARKRQKRLHVLHVFRWILGLTNVAMGGTQVGLAAASGGA